VIINWISLGLGFIVSIFTSQIMWTIQMEECMIHEGNFRESIKMLVVNEDTIPDLEEAKEQKEQETEASIVSKK
jgi:hypothetical protein